MRTQLEILPGDKGRVKGVVTAVFKYLYVCRQEINKLICIAPQGRTSNHREKSEGG
jgi:hypothetical protein